MSFYNTGNPVPSIDPRDLDDNAKHLDDFVNGTEDTYTDRLGVERRTLFSIQHDADASLLRSDLANPTDPVKGATLVGYKNRTTYARLNDFPTSVKDNGALGNAVASDAAPINAILAAGNNAYIPRGNYYNLESGLLYVGERAIEGAGSVFNGTVLKPSGNFPAITGSAPASQRLTVSGLQINGENITTEYAVKIVNAFVHDWHDIWLRNTKLGLRIESSNALFFYSLRVMETPTDTGVSIFNSTSIHFIGCNFETNVANRNVGGIFRIDSDWGGLSNADLTACQFERSGIDVGAGCVKAYGGVASDTFIDLGRESRDCYIDMETTGSTVIHDFGMGNEVKNAFCQNMATPVHRWPMLRQVSPVATPAFGQAGDEWVYLMSAGSKGTTGVTSGTIQVKEGVTVLDTSPTFNFPAYGNTIGLTPRRTFSFLSVVRNVAGPTAPTFNNCFPFAIRGGRNLLTNGTFQGGATTGWTLASVTASGPGPGVTLTPTASNWTILQNFSAFTRPGRRYIAVAKFSGNASLTWGNASDGSAGARISSDPGKVNLYGDGDTVAMVSFEYYSGLSPNLSLGAVGSNTPVTLDWIGLIDATDNLDEQIASKVFDPPSIAAGAQTSTNVTVSGAQIGDFVTASFSLDQQGIALHGYVSAASTVTVLFKNGTVGAVDLGSGTLRVVVSRFK